MQLELSLNCPAAPTWCSRPEAVPYNSSMLDKLLTTVTPAVIDRVLLLVNHVIAAEPAAGERLRAHIGRCIRLQVDGWPRLLPPWPPLLLRITPAGLFEWLGAPGDELAGPAPAADLLIELDGSNPLSAALRLAGGEPPAVQLHGDAALAADIDWLAANLRWDIEADLARVVDPRVAHELARFGRLLAGGLRAALRGGAQLAGRLRAPSPR